jgi:predicted CopG family antitoxin
MGFLKGIFVRQEQYEMLLETKKANKLKSMAEAMALLLPLKKDEKKQDVVQNETQSA